MLYWRNIDWESKRQSILLFADEVFKEGNINLDLSDKSIYPLASFLGGELEDNLRSAGSDADSVHMLHEWLRVGFAFEDFKLWSPAQYMVAYACWLVNESQQWEECTPDVGHSWDDYSPRRDQAIEQCSTYLIDALQACYFGRSLINEKIVLDQVQLAEIEKAIKSKNGRAGGTAKAAKYEPLEKFARDLAKKGVYPSKRQAAKGIKSDVLKRAKEISISLSEDNAERMIGEWLTGITFARKRITNT